MFTNLGFLKYIIISAQLSSAEDPHSVSVRVITLTFIYEVTNKVSTMLKMKIFIPLVRPYLPPLADITAS